MAGSAFRKSPLTHIKMPTPGRAHCGIGPKADDKTMFKDILLPITDSDPDRDALRKAIELAGRHQAHLAVLVTVPLHIPPGFEWGAIPADLYARMHEAQREHGARTANWVRDELARAAQEGEVRVVETQLLPAARMAALHARHADLAVVACPVPGRPDDIFLEMLFDSGRPVLVVPGGAGHAPPPGHVVVAWQPTREAARAVHDAMPLLQEAKSVDVLVIDPRVDEHRHGAVPGADISAHLARHGIRVTTVSVPSAGDDIATRILRHVVESGAELLVAGAYSHARWRELVLGGVTRTLLETSPVPVLYSH
jgi:nucleotide-binding universal stress UspA family protein